MKLIAINLLLFGSQLVHGQSSSDSSRLSLSIVCSSKEQYKFIIKLVNWGDKPVLIPKHPIHGFSHSLEVNIGYEIEFCKDKDTLAVSGKWGEDIGARRNREEVSLDPLDNMLYEVGFLTKLLLKEKGTYRIRFVFKQGFSVFSFTEAWTEWEYFLVKNLPEAN